MSTDQHIWRVWISAIYRWGLQDWVANLLDTLIPVTILGAQLIYLGEPVFKLIVSETYFDAAARLLEDPQNTRMFLHMLADESRSENV